MNKLSLKKSLLISGNTTILITSLVGCASNNNSEYKNPVPSNLESPLVDTNQGLCYDNKDQIEAPSKGGMQNEINPENSGALGRKNKTILNKKRRSENDIILGSFLSLYNFNIKKRLPKEPLYMFLTIWKLSAIL